MAVSRSDPVSAGHPGHRLRGGAQGQRQGGQHEALLWLGLAREAVWTGQVARREQGS